MARCATCGRRWNGPHPNCAEPAEPTTTATLLDTPPVLDGFTLFRLLGQGGYASVYAAQRDRDGLTVAIKVASAKQPGSASALRREAIALRTVGPPHAPQVFAEGVGPNGDAFIAMELFDGSPLTDRLEQTEAGLPVDQVLALGAAIARSVSAAHVRGLVHRDLKPENIFIFPAPLTARVLDFGLATQIDGAFDSDETAAAGTAEYMAPEQCEGLPESARPQADVYSLGVLLYEMLTARPPFWGSTAEVRQAQQSRRPALPSSLVPVPAALESVILKCLAKDATQRYSNAQAVLEALEAVRADTSPVVTTTAKAAGAKPTLERRMMALLFFESSAPLTKIKTVLAAALGQLASVSGQRYVAAFGEDVSDNPVRRATRVGERLINEGLAPRQLVDVARITVQRRPDGTHRLMSPLFSRADRFPSAQDPEGVLLTTEAASALGDLQTVPVPGRNDVLLLSPATIADPSTDTFGAGTFGGTLGGNTLSGGTERPFVGRDALLQTLKQDAAASVSAGKPSIALVTGEPGQGRSRLLAMLTTPLAALQPTPMVVHLRAREPVAGEPHDTLRTLLSRALAVPLKAPDDWRTALRQTRLRETLSDDAALAVALVMGWVSTEAPELKRLMAVPGVLAGLASRAAGDGLRNLAQKRPVCLLLDDAHHADSATINALQYATLSEGGAAIWVCAAIRTGFEGAFPAVDRAPFTLSPLDPADAETLCRKLLEPAEHVPADAVKRLVERTHGSPQQLVELIHRLKRDGLVRQDGQRSGWYLATDELDRFADAPVLEWVAKRELLALSADLMAHAQLAALLGSDFRDSEVAGVLSELEREGLGRDFPLDAKVGLSRLVEAEVLRQHRDSRLSFRSGLLRDTILSSVAPALAQQVHAAAVRFYRADKALPRSERTGRLAIQAEKSGLTAEAAELYLGLADELRRRHAYLDAEGTYSRAAAVLGEQANAERLKCMRGRGLMRYRLGRHADALGDLKLALELARGLNDQAAQIEVMLDQATTLDWMGDYTHSRELAEAAAALAGSTPTPVLSSAILMAQGRTHFRDSNYAAAATKFEQAVKVGQEAGDDAYESVLVSLLLLGPLYCLMGRVTEAEDIYSRCIALTTERHDRLHLSAAITNRLILRQLRRDAEGSIEDVKTGMTIGRELGLVDVEVRGEINLADLIFQTGDVEAARLHTDRGLKGVERFGGLTDPRRVPLLLLHGRINLLEGLEADARRRLEQIRELEAQLKAKGVDIVPADESFARMIDLATRESTEAEWDELERFAEKNGVQQDPIEVVEMRGLWEQRRGRGSLARGCLERALKLAETIPNLMEPRLKKALQAMS